MDLNTSLKETSKSYKIFAKRLEKLGIIKLIDFLYHIPFRYENYALVSKIGQVQAGETVTIRGKVEEIKNEFTSHWKKLQKAKISDKTGEINVIWFNQPYLLKTIKKGDLISLSGKASLFKGIKTLNSPDFEVIFDPAEQTIHTGRLVPVYPETRGVSSKWLRRQIYNLLKIYEATLKEFLPEEIIRNNNLIDLSNAIFNIHFPKSLDEASKSRERFSFEELFLMQLIALKRKREWSKNKLSKPFEIKKFQKQLENLFSSLPFQLTNAQEKSVKEIFTDFSKSKPMNRLLEGEVGSGKTVVAAIAMYLTFLNGKQSVLMAPTEILAQQHFETIRKLLVPFGTKIELITSSTKAEKKQKVKNKKQKLETGNQLSDITIGTHAVLYQKIGQNNVGFVVIDEQQRFGVEQRAILRQMGKDAHVLTMTATPIPRTVALTMYGDLELSFLDETPKGRKKIKTWLVPPEKREGAYNWIQNEIIKNKSQVFIICPLIEESENLISVKAVTKEYEWLKDKIFPKLKLGLLHGRMKSAEKEEALKKFKDKKIDILVATSVVEVGIDIPNATIMLIEQSERFGLAQLHQLRGRVGRGDKQSYCLLFTSATNPKTIERLKSMEVIDFGPELAELDLKLRGPGQIFGTLQHGVPALKVASFSDFDLIKKTRKAAEETIDYLNKYPLLEQKIEEIENKNISPD
jgi:ATP-dependent DNA helicase RecG